MESPFLAILSLLSNTRAFALMVFFFAASIFVHELGHFLAALWRGLKVTRFSIGFGPVLWSKTYKGVQYCLCALPLGGYVALPELGHIEAIEGKAQTEDKTRKISWTSKVIVLVAGAFFNVLFALVLATILYFAGIPDSSAHNTTTIGYIPEQLTLTTGTSLPNPAKQAGLLRGDKILKVDGQEVEKWQDVEVYLAVGVDNTDEGYARSTLLIDRQGEEMEITLYPARLNDDYKRFGGMWPIIEPTVMSLLKDFPADQAGIEPGDTFVEINGKPIVTATEISEVITTDPTQSISVKLSRPTSDGPETYTTQLTPRYSDQYGKYMIGVDWGRIHYIKGVSPFKQIGDVVDLTFLSLSRMLHPKSDVGIKDTTGVVGMGKIMYDSAKTGMRHMLFIVILINVNLAILNLLPIPVLDGGHILFASIEKLRGKPVPQNILMTLQGTFILLLLFFMVFVSVNDVKRFFLRPAQAETSISETEKPTEEEAIELQEAAEETPTPDQP